MQSRLRLRKSRRRGRECALGRDVQSRLRLRKSSMLLTLINFVRQSVLSAMISMCSEDVNQEINEGVNYETNREALLANEDDAITNQDGVITNQETDRNTLFDNLKVSLPPKSLLILGFCRDRELTKKEIFSLLGVTNQTNNVRTNIAPLIGNGLLARSLSKLSSKGQRYVTTKLGSDFLDYINGLY